MSVNPTRYGVLAASFLTGKKSNVIRTINSAKYGEKQIFVPDFNATNSTTTDKTVDTLVRLSKFRRPRN
jgi:hypothetical protein